MLRSGRVPLSTRLEEVWGMGIGAKNQHTTLGISLVVNNPTTNLVLITPLYEKKGFRGLMMLGFRNGVHPSF